jgi:hypothetical protein
MGNEQEDSNNEFKEKDIKPMNKFMPSFDKGTNNKSARMKSKLRVINQPINLIPHLSLEQATRIQ